MTSSKPTKVGSFHSQEKRKKMAYNDIDDAKEESIIDTLEWCLKHSKKEIRDRLRELRKW